MVDALLAGAMKALQGLIISGVVYGAYWTATKALDEAVHPKPFALLLKSFVLCGVIALFAAVTMGEPSCEERDPEHGDCEVYSDDGYDPTKDEQVKFFAQVFLLLYAPVLLAVANGNERHGLKA